MGIIFVSNNSKKSRQQVAERLGELGIKLPKDGYRSILNTSYTCAWFLKRFAISKPFIICSHIGLLEELKLMGICNYYATITDSGEAKKEYLEPVTLERITALIEKQT